MKKFMILALALVATFMFVVPAMAVDVEFSGHYRVRGFWTDNMELNKDESESDAAFDHRIRIKPVFKITDNITLTTRFDGQDNRAWGDDTGVTGTRGSGTTSKEDFGLERVYADINLDTVTLRVGRMAAGFCGISYCDSEGDADRIKVILNDIDPFYLDFTYQKTEENDYQGDEADEDFDAYYLHGFYTSETLFAGLLWGYYDDAGSSETLTAAETIAGVPSTYKANYWLYNPYIQGTAGPIAYMAEAQWFTGDYRDYTDSTSDVDYDAWRWIVDLAFNADPGSVGAGWAHSDGRDATEDDYTIADGGGNDWQPFLILTHYYANANLGGLGNLNQNNNDAGLDELGFDIYYVYGSYTPMEKLTLSAILGWAYADEDNTTALGKVDDDIGWEFNIGAKYQIMDNLSYDVTLGYFSPGDLWEDAHTNLGTPDATDYDDATYSMLHALVVTF